MKTFSCWCPDWSGDAADASNIEAVDARMAAETFLEKNNHDDPVEEAEVMVAEKLADGTLGPVREFCVTAEWEVTYCAMETPNELDPRSLRSGR